MNPRSYFCGGTAVAAVLTLLAAGPAMAQTAPATPAPAGPAATPGSISELVVTAERREERLQDVPVAVTAFSAEQRSLIGIQTVQDLTNFTPGLHLNGIANRPYLRGVGRNTDNLAVASAVATYYNGVYAGSNATTLLQHSDLFIDTIEVDRGPQNTLHGANADGGTINYISKRPTKDYYAEGRVGAANYGSYFGEAVVSGPINDNFRFRLGGNYSDQSGGHGYFKNLNGPSQGGNLPQGNSGASQYVEAQLDGNFGEHLDGWAMVSQGKFSLNYHTVATRGAITDVFQQNGTFAPSSFYGLCGVAGAASSLGGTSGCAGGPTIVGSPLTQGILANQFAGNNPSTDNPRDFIQNATSTNKLKGDIAFATNWTYHMPGMDLTYLAGYQKFNYQLNFTTAAESGILSYQTAGAPAVGGLCALDAAGAGYSAAACTQPLTINPAPNTTYFAEKDSFFSHEIDLASTTGGPLQWIAGAYYYGEHYEQPVDAGVLPNQTQFAHPYYLNLTTFALTPAPANPASAWSTSDTFLKYESYAAFGQVSYALTDAWKLTGALRYNHDHKSGLQQWRFEEFDVTPGLQSASFGANTPAIDFTAVAVGEAATTAYKGASVARLNSVTGNWERNLDETWTAWTGDVNLDWSPTRNTLAYAKYSRGYKAGGFSTFTIAPNPETDAETVDAFEVGLKKTIARQLQVNAAAFYYNYKNDQIPLSVQNAQGLVASQLFNLKSVHISGFELEGTWQPIDPVVVNFQYSHLSAKVHNPGGCFEDIVDPLGTLPGVKTAGCTQTSATTVVQNLTGQTLPEAPPNKVSVNGLYTIDFNPGKLTLSASYIWKDKTYGSLFNRYYSKSPAYDQVNLRATWTDASNRYNVIVFMNNVFDKVGYDNTTGTLLVAPTATTAGQVVINNSLTAPRTYGVELRYRFQ
jgi:iron complex outermembrane receptor protein